MGPQGCVSLRPTATAGVRNSYSDAFSFRPDSDLTPVPRNVAGARRSPSPCAWPPLTLSYRLSVLLPASVTHTLLPDR